MDVCRTAERIWFILKTQLPEAQTAERIILQLPKTRSFPVPEVFLQAV